MSGFSTKALLLLLASFVLLLPPQAVQKEAVGCHSRGGDPMESASMAADLASGGGETEESNCCGGISGCPAAGHCVIVAIAPSEFFSPLLRLVPRRFSPSDAHAASLLITSIYRPPWA